MRDESGMALLVTLLLLLLMSAIAVAAIEHSGEESALGGRSRRSLRTLHAADGGMQVGMSRVVNAQFGGFSGTLQDGTTYRSGDRTASAPQPVQQLGSGPPPEGNCIGVGASCYRSDLVRQTVSAFAPDGATAEVSAQFAVVQAGTGGYQ
jgi:hypothetical protein